MNNVKTKFGNRPKFSKLLVRHQRLRKKLETSEQKSYSSSWVKEEYVYRTQEIDDLWNEGHLSTSLDKTIELYDFLDFHGAIELRFNYCGPCMNDQIIV